MGIKQTINGDDRQEASAAAQSNTRIQAAQMLLQENSGQEGATQAKKRASGKTGPGKTGPKKLKAIPGIDGKLQIWARWRLMNDEQGPGEAYGCSMLGALIAGGGQHIRSTNSSSDSMPDDIFDTDRAVTKLPLELRMVVEAQYLDVHLELAEKCGKAGCSKPTFYKRLYKAQHQILFMLKPPEHLAKRLAETG
ncbi:hypothetical protein [Oceanospirillum beijerinckii]|uniref:hypothetical protein n=1 Tax=Oceanospirillum beijerinckii TaxID=64976 RepID=UPI00040179CB|nr:hypothetical protein [Oceanospirillum beijerinckii]